MANKYQISYCVRSKMQAPHSIIFNSVMYLYMYVCMYTHTHTYISSLFRLSSSQIMTLSLVEHNYSLLNLETYQDFFFPL